MVRQHTADSRATERPTDDAMMMHPRGMTVPSGSSHGLEQLRCWRRVWTTWDPMRDYYTYMYATPTHVIGYTKMISHQTRHMITEDEAFSAQVRKHRNLSFEVIKRQGEAATRGRMTESVH